MRIEHFNSTKSEGLVRASARIVWEDSDRPPQEIYFETEARFAEDLTCNPHAFLVGCLPPAMRLHEQRIKIDAPVCQILADRLRTNMAWFKQWYGPAYQPPVLEPAPGRYSSCELTLRRTGMFLSGGVDSLFTLQRNRAYASRSYPGSIQDGFLVHGFEIYHSPDAEKHLPFFARAVASMQTVADNAGLTLIPVYTNIRHLDQDGIAWIHWNFGAALASVAHAFARRVSQVYLASGDEIAKIRPWGSHPLLDANYGSMELRINHDGERYTRLEKVRALRAWPSAMKFLRVCVKQPEQGINCGRCEKCVRTMLELMAAGACEGLAAFGLEHLSVQNVARIQLRQPYLDEYYEELLVPLRAAGREDLASAVEERLADRVRVAAWKSANRWRTWLKRVDARYFGGVLGGLHLLLVRARRSLEGAGT